MFDLIKKGSYAMIIKNPSYAQTKCISAIQAFEILNQNPSATLIDVRTNMEFLFIGHPVGAIHVPFMEEPDWDINPDFVNQVKNSICRKNNRVDLRNELIILICRSGNRSAQAAQLLQSAGLNNVYHIPDGFEGELNDNHHRSRIEGWRFFDLPWEQC